MGVEGSESADRILDAAGEVFARRGIAGATMGEVARAAGCSRATLYRHVEDRHALQVAFVHREARRLAQAVAEQVPPGADPADRLVSGVLATLALVRAQPALAAWFARADAGGTAALAQSSPVIEALAVAFLGQDPARPVPGDVAQRARWLVRVIVSLLTMPGADEAEERALVARFVAPVVVAAEGAGRRR